MINKILAQKKFLKNSLTLIAFLTAFLIPLLAKSLLAQNIPITTDSRIKTLVYNPNEVYQLKFHYGYQSFIEFGEDESIEMISIGESFAWRLTPAGRRLFVRPLEVAAHTNMTIITNHRTYQFDIRSGEYDGKADEELVYVVRFFYPEVRLQKPIPQQLTKPNPGARKRRPQRPPGSGGVIRKPPGSGGVIRSRSNKLSINDKLTGMLALNSSKNKINFNYQFAGSAPDITPIKVFDNGQETSFQFKNNNLIIPTISSVDIFGNEVLASYVIKDNYIVIPNVSSQFTLRLADSLLCVFNNKIITGR
jgi:type IV secretion system protein VirB9